MADNLVGFIMIVMGAWLLSDSIWSIFYYLGRENETFWRNHSVRIVRGFLAIILIVIGGIQIIG